MTLMYYAATPPADFHSGIAWAGYLDSPTAAAPWPVDSLKAALTVGLLPVYVAPLTSDEYIARSAKADAEDAIRQAKALGGEGLTVALDTEERAYEAAALRSVTYARVFALVAHQLGGVCVHYGSEDFLNALRPHTNLGLAWLAKWTNDTTVWPLPKWKPPHAWQYAGNVIIDGKQVDISRLDPGFPLMGLHKNNQPTRLKLRARRAERVLINHLEKRKSPIADPDRAPSSHLEQLLAEKLAL